MTLDEYRESRRPFSELISIDPNEMFKLESEPERLTPVPNCDQILQFGAIDIFGRPRPIWERH